MKIIKQSIRNIFSRHLHAMNDKEKIAGWKSDLARILHVFTVRFIVFIMLLLTRHFQTELAINTHVAVSDTRTMVSDTHRTIVKGREGSDGKSLSVSDVCTLSVIE